MLHFFCFFKQKTAYEMRISDWSSDVCSSDLTSPLVEFRGVEKRYAAGDPVAVADLDLAIERGEFLTLLGPSGSGKTTTLMMLAGFETPSAGEILLGGASLAHRPPYRRNMGVVRSEERREGKEGGRTGR